MNPRMIGGEMLIWSDLDGLHGPGPVRGSVLEALVAAAASGRTLMAGPHDLRLIDALPISDLTLLVRGVPDAVRLADRYADRPDVTVLCGGLEKLVGEEPYDTVVALDGLGRLISAEGADLSWGEAFDLLVASVRPGGRVLLAVENFFGLHRLVALRPELTDSDWVVSDEYDVTRPTGLARVMARFGQAGLDVDRAYAAYPLPLAPAVLLDRDILADDARSGFVASMLGRAERSTDEALADPVRLAAGAVRHGAVADVAPAWIVVARAPGGPAGSFPSALIDAGGQRVEVRRTAEGWVQDNDGAVPAGRTLEELLIAASLRRDLPAVRDLVGAWLRGDDAGVAADQIVVEPDGTFVALDRPGEPLVAVRSFAATLIGGGYPHPWPTGDAVELTVLLAAMAGYEYGREAVAAADPGGIPARPDARNLREVAAARDRLARELAEAKAKLLWYEEMLTDRENVLKRALRTNELLSASGPARAGKALIGGARVARRSVRSTVRRFRRR
jgi:hypothetical protein